MERSLDVVGKTDGLHFTISDTGWGKALWGKYYGQWMNEAAIFTYDFDKFDAHDILPMFAKYHITTFCAPPTMYRFFIKEDLSKYDLSSIEYYTTAGEALNPEVYIYRETGILTLIGTAIGLIFGIFLHAFVVKTAEVDMVMFGREIKWLSYVFSALLTIFFSIIVNLVMYRKLKKISMVESMKSTE